VPRIASKSSENALVDAPKPDAIEVSIFGPGKGESILVHLGANEWMIVDSCIDARDRSLPAIAYLDRIGVDPGTQVKLVVATHAHDDHIAGMARVVRACKSAQFAASQAVASSEFFYLLEEDTQLEDAFGVKKGVLSEYRAIFDVIDRRVNSAGIIPFKRAVQELPLLMTKTGSQVMALSPSHQAVTRSLQALAASMKTAGQTPKLTDIDPNEFAVALWVSAGSHQFLLGADLLRGPSGSGWTAILDWHRPELPASIFKVPHHGAPNAHHDDVWARLVAPDAIAILAPYRAGVHPRPGPEDRKRIAAFTPNAFVTADPDAMRPSRAAKKFASSLGPLAKNVRDPWGIPGHVRARLVGETSEWEITLVAPARRIDS
jgi:beta-lactamase superfamily II metal-dependent hydrolase